MATRRGPRLKECRRLGVNVCGHPKAMNRAGAPAFNKRRKVSEYSMQLTEKQKVKAYYGILEKQMVRYYRAAEKSKGKTGDALQADMFQRFWTKANKSDNAMRAVHFQLAFIWLASR